MKAALYFAVMMLVLSPVVATQTGFTAQAPIPVSQRPDGVAIADLDGDGVMDLAVVSDVPDKVTVHFGSGGGSFGAPAIVPLGAGVSAQGIAAADLDLDGDTDLAVSLDNAAGVVVLRNLGSGTFSLLPTIPTGAGARAIRAADLDGNGAADLVVVNRDADSVSVVLDPTGAALTATSPVGLDPRDATVADFDGNGSLDIAVASHDARQVELLINNGSGAFSASAPLSVGAQLRPEGIASADLDGDGDVDLATSTSGNGLNFVSVFLNDGFGGFTGPTNVPSGGQDPDAIVAEDLDGDGLSDLAVAHQDSHVVSILTNTGAATFTGSATLSGGVRPEALAVGDLDGNGSPDLVASWRDSNDVRVWLNQAVFSAQLSLLSPAMVGAVTTLRLTSPADAGRPYLCGFSGGMTPGFLLPDGRPIPLNMDFVFTLSQTPGNGIFLNTSGTLDPSGTADVTIVVPSIPALSGATFFAAFVTLDAAAQSGIATVSGAQPLAVL